MTTWEYNKNFIISGSPGNNQVDLKLDDIETVKQLNVLLEAIYLQEDGGDIINLVDGIKDVLEIITPGNKDENITQVITKLLDVLNVLNNKQPVSLSSKILDKITITGVTDSKDKQSLANLIVSNTVLRGDIKTKVDELQTEINKK